MMVLRCLLLMLFVLFASCEKSPKESTDYEQDVAPDTSSTIEIDANGVEPDNIGPDMTDVGDEPESDSALPDIDVSDTEDITQQDTSGAVWGPDECPPLPPETSEGFEIGDQIGSLAFYDCAGEPFPLENFCGADATWIFFAHAWCGDCQATAGFAEEVQAYFAKHNVAVVQIVVHSIGQELPGPQDCSDWKELWGFQEVTTLHDPFFMMVQLADTGQTGLSVLLDDERVIRKKLHVFDETAIIGEIQALLTEDSP